MTVNVELLTEIMDYISKHPMEWNQRAWRLPRGRYGNCGTTHCIAGFAAVMTDAYFISDDRVIDPTTQRVVYIAEYAQQVLGLTERQARNLFYNYSGFSAVRQMVDDIIASEGAMDIGENREWIEVEPCVPEEAPVVEEPVRELEPAT